MTTEEVLEEGAESDAVPIEEIAYASVLELNHQAYKDIEAAYGELFVDLRERDIDEANVEAYRNALQHALFVLEEKVEPLTDVE